MMVAVFVIDHRNLALFVMLVFVIDHKDLAVGKELFLMGKDFYLKVSVLVDLQNSNLDQNYRNLRHLCLE